MSELVSILALVLALILIIAVGYSIYIIVKKNQNRDHRLKQIQQRLHEIETQKASEVAGKEN